MSTDSNIKRQILRGVVEDNITSASLAGGFHRRRRQESVRRWTARGRWILLPIAIAVVVHLVGAVSAAWREQLEVEPVAVATDEAAGAEAESTSMRSVNRLPPLREELLASATFDSPPTPLDPAVFPLGVRRVVVDPGHGGKSPGTSAPGGLSEKEVALDIGLRLRELLEEASFEVLMTRDEDETVSLDERAVYANSRAGDIFVSIHLNWIPKRRTRGVETYYLGPTDDPELAARVARENQDSGYSMADMKALLERVYLDVRSEKSRHLAESVQQELYGSLKEINPKISDRGVKTAPFIVLLATEMPAILAEVSCLSNAQEAKLLETSAYRQRIAQSLFEGIRQFAEEPVQDLDEEKGARQG